MNRAFCLVAILFLLTTFVLGGCSVTSTVRPESYYDSVRPASLDTDEPVSLFPGDASVLTDDAIKRILDYRYLPPALSRIALIPAGREMWSGWSEGLAIATEQLEKDVVSVLEASPRVYDAAFLPSVLTPERRSVPHLREAAARFQADLMLVYRNFCRSFQKYRVFRDNRARAFCGVEAVLIDTRTGIVPLSVVASRTFDVEQSADDLSFRETVLKAQLAAVAGSLSEVVSDVVVLLEAHRDSGVPG